VVILSEVVQFPSWLSQEESDKAPSEEERLQRAVAEFKALMAKARV
jgi:hypothetical protein